MATKYGYEAIEAWKKIRANFKKRRNIFFGVIVLIIVYVVATNT